MTSRSDDLRIPRHVAIIMDGNGRWAKRRHLPRIAGHRRGVEAVRLVVETAARINLPALTIAARKIFWLVVSRARMVCPIAPFCRQTTGK